MTLDVFIITACLPIFDEVSHAVLHDLKLWITRMYKTYIPWKTWAKITSHSLNIQSDIWFENSTSNRIFTDSRLLNFQVIHVTGRGMKTISLLYTYAKERTQNHMYFCPGFLVRCGIYDKNCSSPLCRTWHKKLLFAKSYPIRLTFH